MTYSLKQKTQLYHQLYVSHKAALPLAVMLSPDLLPAAFGRYAVPMQRMLDKGRPLSAILATTKLVAPWEAKLLAVGEHSGKLDVALADLEAFFSARQQQLSALKAKLLYPAIVFLVAIVTGPVPALARGTLSLTGYLTEVVVKLAVFYLVYQVLLVRTLERSVGGAFNPMLIRVARSVDSTHWLRQLFEVSYLNLLTACLDAGMDAAETLRILKDAIDDKRMRAQHMLALNKVQKHGMSLSQALTSSGILQNYQIISFFNTAEHAGALHSDLRRFVLAKRGELANLVQFKLKIFGKWLYIGIMLLTVAGFFG